MIRFLVIAICIAFLLFGLIRIGVGGALMGQTAGWWALGGELPDAVEETRRFIGERQVNLVGFTPFTYFGFILFMGLSLTLGAIGQLARSRWGLVLIVLYLVSHAFLFINFMTINPKIAYLAIGIGLTLVLAWANGRPAERSGEVGVGEPRG